LQVIEWYNRIAFGFGWHRVTVLGDVKEPLVEFGKALGLKGVEEA
jgi:hypothetical protein